MNLLGKHWEFNRSLAHIIICIHALTHKLTYIFLSLPEESTDVTLNQSKFVVRLYIWTDPLRKLADGTVVCKPGERERERERETRKTTRDNRM